MHVVNAPWYARRKVIHGDLKIDPISEFIKKTCIRVFDKLPEIRNELLQRPAFFLITGHLVPGPGDESIVRIVTKTCLRSSYPQFEETSKNCDGCSL
ncbi:hypothetical protein AVEN_209659-1 [Araneus ventricosus]|uniref:Uncharacterized protein n=1 Tax=Araneus ventricosus TaxID=182803 RepID=A0A4Y2D8R5_ARAVE|nr:hypothetical protein AVEN_209659-1 [Araneus ventricosus]